MNIFKNGFKIAMSISLIFLLSCEKDQIDTNDKSLTEEIARVETRYKEGDIKIEIPWEPGFEKNEQITSPRYDLKIRQELEKSYSKQTTYLKSAGNTVGVIKNGSCGSYQELYIFMDCEDSGAASSETGWNGDCWVQPSARNVTLFFCVVDGAYFQRTNVDYAVLNLSSSAWPSGVSKIRNWMDNEDKGNINKITQGGTGQTNGTSIGGTNKYDNWYGETGVGSNTMLGYYYYPKTTTTTAFPSLNGISYGVFGSFGTEKGQIFIDNEDGASSWVGVSLWTNAQFSGLGTETFTFDTDQTGGVVKVDHNSNTTMFFSKVQ